MISSLNRSVSRRTNTFLALTLSCFTVAQLALTQSVQAATTLAAGDVAFSAFQADNAGGNFAGDALEFVLLVPVTAGTTLYFTDNGYRTDSSTFRTNENVVRWVAQTDLPAGTIRSFIVPGGTNTPNTAEWTGISPTTGAALPNAALQLAAGGDNISAIQTPNFGGADALTGTAIAQITFGGATFAPTFTAASGNTTTALAPGLTDGTNAISLAATDNGRYNANATGSIESGTQAEVRTSLNTDIYWQTSTTPFTPGGSNTTFTISTSAITVPTITTQPSSQTINSGSTATLTVTATGGSLGYQWYQGVAGDTVNPVNGATSASFTTPALTNNTNYWVRVTNTAGSVDSETATITVNAAVLAPSISSQSGNQSIPSGQTTTLSVVATGTAPLNYQWYQGITGDTVNPVNGATSASFTTPALTNSTNYWVRVTNTAGSADSATIEITVTAVPVVLIHDIQGSGTTAALTGNRTIEGIVVRAFLGSTQLNGFYVQEEDADADANPATSEGIFVFDPSGLFSGTAGTKVRVTGTVGEFTSAASSLTQITSVTSVINLGAATLPTAVNVQLPVSNVSDLERYEGMLVNLSAASGNLTVTENFQLGRFGQVLLSAPGSSNQPSTDGRLDQYTQFNPPSVSGYTAYLAEDDKRLIYLDDGRSSQNPDPIVFGRGGNPLSAANTLRGGDTVPSITGILDERFEGYRIQTATGVNFTPANSRPATPPTVGGTLKIGSFNVLNYFNGNGIGGGFPTSRGADTQIEFTRQRDKTILAILDSGTDVLGLIEIENDGYVSTSALQDLVNGLNAVAGAGTYALINPGTSLGTDEIVVALLYKPSVVTPIGAAAAIPNSYGTGAFDVVGRKPLAQTFQQNATGEQLTVVVVHYKSKGSSSGGAGDFDSGDGQGLSNGTRTRQSQDLVAWLATRPTGSNDPDYMILGDLNAYAKEDPLTTLETAGYVNLVAPTSYSYVFDGRVGALDHAFGSASLVGQKTGADKWHINADEPTALDYNTEFKSTGQISSLYAADVYRNSDHDPVLVGLSLGVPAATLTSLSPASGPVNSSVILQGTNFIGATAVRFNGVNAAFGINSATQITATVPATATTGPITVITPSGTATSPNGFTVLTAPPVLSSLSPTSGPVGTLVTLNGTNFTGATVVKFYNNKPASFTVVSPTQITVTVPAGALTGTLSVTTPSGTGSSRAKFTVTAP